MNDHEILLTGRGALPFRFPLPPFVYEPHGCAECSCSRMRESTLEIPRKLHMVWIGGKIPDRYATNLYDFSRHNPDWDVMLWHDMNVPGVVDRMHNRDLFHAETNIAARVDLLRYELVYQEGGVYLDADTLSLAPGSLERMTHAFLTVSGPPWYNTGNAQFGFAAGSEFLAYVIQHARDPRVRAREEIPERTGPTFLTTCALSFDDWRIIHPNGAWLLEKVHHCAHKNW